MGLGVRMTHVTMDQTFLWDPIFFGTKNLLDLKDFQTQIFFQPKIFSDSKWTSMKMIIWGIKQTFWTWGFLNLLMQMFYFNWSLTLKTKSCLLIFHIIYHIMHQTIHHIISNIKSHIISYIINPKIYKIINHLSYHIS